MKTEAMICKGLQFRLHTLFLGIAGNAASLFTNIKSPTRFAMKIKLYSIGKEDNHDIKMAVESFSRRIKHYYPMEWGIIAPLKRTTALTGKELKEKEAGQVFEILKKNDYLIVLDEKGKMLTSIQLASFMQTKANESTKQLVFLIGGAYGLDEAIIKRANFVWSLSPLTFPHQLVRLILAEQVYRACTIIKNEKYHHA